ncbi:hypothetical protein TREMEDRAFT_57028, partial [Tremella mesenterica DSM 1558]|uniref:uncharacterized protein n=1 Tax=Tremella mesenterica (strain ATCC 24925 / CBS 8224 / DSM 1558 / NBRC 9311 / NRRL Y-6157 / RJB 2259-6 / UBC 559-6) TaxID=578456 RepID=UPI0003F49EE0
MSTLTLNQTAARLSDTISRLSTVHIGSDVSRQNTVEPLKQPSTSQLSHNEQHSPGTVLSAINQLSGRVSDIMDMIYEAQEMRHMQAVDTRPRQIDSLLTTIRNDLDDITPQYSALKDKIIGMDGNSQEQMAVDDGMDQLTDALEKLVGEVAVLEEEVKASDWIQSFRETAQRAQALLDSLQKSLDECMGYVDRVIKSSTQVPYNTELDDQLSIRRLEELAQGHASMKGSYGPTISRTLKQMEKFLTSRPAKNG